MSTFIPEKLEKEPTIFQLSGNKVHTSDREIEIVAKFDEPLILVFGSVLDDTECDALIQVSKSRLARSKIGGTREVSEQRTSSGAFLEPGDHEVVLRVERRLAELTGIPHAHGEGLHILNYLPGQEYKTHFDYFAETSKAAQNNRIATVVLYLNDVEEGGETYFPELKLSIFPKKGMAVYFEYFYNDRALNELTLHGGAPVIKGEKWIATQWIRKQRVE